METIDIFYQNLDQETQQGLLKLYEVETPEQMNWDVFPIEVIRKEPIIKRLTKRRPNRCQKIKIGLITKRSNLQ